MRRGGRAVQRPWVGKPLLISSTSLTAPAARVVMWTTVPTVTAGVFVTPSSSQLRVNASAPALSLSSSVAAPSAWVLARSGASTVSTGTTVTSTAVRLRVRTAVPTLTTLSGISAPSAQVRLANAAGDLTRIFGHPGEIDVLVML